ncbi:MAG: helix-hairpin-helix domain-containing protein, partial [Bacteroidota bacterium]
LENTDKAIDGTIKAGKEWQALFQKSIKNGSRLATNQQDIVFDTLEGIKKQAVEGRKRWRQLFDFNFTFSPAETLAELPGADTVKKVAKQVENQVETAKAVARSVVKEVAKQTVEVAEQAEDIVEDLVEEASEAVVEGATAIVKKVEEVEAIAVAKSQKDDLKKINGIGPKIEKLLNEAGIFTYQQLIDAKDEELRAILKEAGPRFKMHNPADWNEQVQGFIK